MHDDISITDRNFLKTGISGFEDYNLEALETKAKEERRSYLNGSVFFFLQSGNATFKSENYSAPILSGMYFCQKAPLEIILAPDSKAMIIEILKYTCLNLTGGPIEATGRLSYINGCSDTLLISPSRMGEPCLNLLHFPSQTNQTIHHHPSFRFGLVVSGEGESISEGGRQLIKSGDCFFIPAMIKHRFITAEQDMNIIAFHPDSDWGPTDEVHPMKNRTIIT